MKYKILKSSSGIVNPIDPSAIFRDGGRIARNVRQMLQSYSPPTPELNSPPNQQPNKSFRSFPRTDNVDVRSLLMFARGEIRVTPSEWWLVLWERERERERERKREWERKRAWNVCTLRPACRDSIGEWIGLESVTALGIYVPSRVSRCPRALEISSGAGNLVSIFNFGSETRGT